MLLDVPERGENKYFSLLLTLLENLSDVLTTQYKNSIKVVIFASTRTLCSYLYLGYHLQKS